MKDDRSKRSVRLGVVAGVLVAGVLAVAIVTLGAIWRDVGEREATTAVVPPAAPARAPVAETPARPAPELRVAEEELESREPPVAPSEPPPEEFPNLTSSAGTGAAEVDRRLEESRSVAEYDRRRTELLDEVAATAESLGLVDPDVLELKIERRMPGRNLTPEEFAAEREKAKREILVEAAVAEDIARQYTDRHKRERARGLAHTLLPAQGNEYIDKRLEGLPERLAQ